MLKNRILSMVMLGAVVAPVAAVQAASDHAFQQGDWELTLSGAGSNDKDFDTGGFNVQANLGYYIIDSLELSLRQGVGYVNTGDDDAFTGSTRIAIDYHFDLDRWQPFIGANIGYLYGSDDYEESFIAGPEAGVKYFVNDTTFIFGTVGYDFLFEDTDDADDAIDDGQFVYGLGIGFKW